MASLTPRQQAFVDAFEGDATAAARAAGYTGKNLSQRGYKLLHDQAIQAAISLRNASRGAASPPPGHSGDQSMTPPADPALSLEEMAQRVGQVRAGANHLKLVPESGDSRPSFLGGIAPPPVITPTKVASRLARQAFWTSVMDDPNRAIEDRLRASELLAKSESDFVLRVQAEHTNIAVINPYAKPPVDVTPTNSPPPPENVGVGE